MVSVPLLSLQNSGMGFKNCNGICTRGPDSGKPGSQHSPGISLDHSRVEPWYIGVVFGVTDRQCFHLLMAVPVVSWACLAAL